MPDLYLKDSLGLTYCCCSPTTVVLWLQLLPSSCSLPPHYSWPSSLPQIKELQLVLAEAHDSLRGLQEQLSQERQLRKEEADNFNQKMVQVRGAQCPTYTYSSLPSLIWRQKSQRSTCLKKARMSGKTWVFLPHGCGVSLHMWSHISCAVLESGAGHWLPLWPPVSSLSLNFLSMKYYPHQSWKSVAERP